MKVLGIDPDTQASGWAIVTEGPRVLKAGCVNTKHYHRKGLEAATLQGKKLAHKVKSLITDKLEEKIDSIVIESQQAYRHSYKRSIDPNKLIILGYVSGAAIGGAFAHDNVRLVPPREWKGNVSKGATHRRIIDALEGWSTPPKVCKSSAITEVTVDPSLDCEFDLDGLVGGGPWSEIMDAIGLAIYGLKRLKCE